MQALRESPSQTLTRRTRKILCAALPVLVLILNGCAVKNSYRFAAKSVTKVSYDPRRCTELPDGRYKCKDVVFTVSAIEPAKTLK